MDKSSLTYREFATDARHQIEQHLQALVPVEPASLYDPVRYLLSAGGKRVRALFTALTAQLSESVVASEAWLPAASAIELLHTFTLVHDDIMDNASSRRGKPTVHVKYGTNEAILSGDVLIALALKVLAAGRYQHLDRLLQEFALGFQLVCDGQALDKEFEQRNEIGVADYLHMIDLKTAKVLELAGVLGALIGAPELVETVRSFAHHIGVSFQILDDLLDLTAKEAALGKKIGGDILEGKRTYLFVRAFEQFSSLPKEDQLLLLRIRGRKAEEADIERARNLFERIGVLEQALAASELETGKALQALEHLPASPAREALRAFSGDLLRRAF